MIIDFATVLILLLMIALSVLAAYWLKKIRPQKAAVIGYDRPEFKKDLKEKLTPVQQELLFGATLATLKSKAVLWFNLAQTAVTALIARTSIPATAIALKDSLNMDVTTAYGFASAFEAGYFWIVPMFHGGLIGEIWHQALVLIKDSRTSMFFQKLKTMKLDVKRLAFTAACIIASLMIWFEAREKIDMNAGHLSAYIRARSTLEYKITDRHEGRKNQLANNMLMRSQELLTAKDIDPERFKQQMESVKLQSRAADSLTSMLHNPDSWVNRDILSKDEIYRRTIHSDPKTKRAHDPFILGEMLSKVSYILSLIGGFLFQTRWRKFEQAAEDAEIALAEADPTKVSNKTHSTPSTQSPNSDNAIAQSDAIKPDHKGADDPKPTSPVETSDNQKSATATAAEIKRTSINQDEIPKDGWDIKGYPEIDGMPMIKASHPKVNDGKPVMIPRNEWDDNKLQGKS